jgi:hypothetical protein
LRKPFSIFWPENSNKGRTRFVAECRGAQALPIRRFWKWAFLVLASGMAQAERVFPPQVTRLSKDTPLFVEPSKQSKQLGDAPKETPVLLRGYSPKKTWVLVEDEEGAQAWVPAGRVEPIFVPPLDEATGEPLADPANPAKNPHAAKEETAAAPEVPANSETLFQPPRTYDLSILGRHEFRAGAPVVLLGAQLSISFYRVLNPGSDRFMRNEWSVAYFRSPESGPARWNLPIRFSLANTRVSSDFQLGPDVGFSWARREAGLEKYFGVGYSAAYKLSQFNHVKVRLSYDLGTHSHFGIEGGAQWMFF